MYLDRLTLGFYIRFSYFHGSQLFSLAYTWRYCNNKPFVESITSFIFIILELQISVSQMWIKFDANG